MSVSKKKTYVHKEKITKKLYEGEASSIKRYKDFFVGVEGISALLKFECITVLFGTLPGALGLLLRKKLYPCLFKSVGRNVLWGRNIVLRHPTNIVVGDNVAIDDNCILDARGAGEEGITIGEDVIIARDTIVQGKCSWVKIGNRSNIGSQCQLSSAGGIELGNCVGIAGQCYIGGGRYGTENTNIPMMDQGPFSQGAVIIGDDGWVGAGAIILDGVRIGKGCFIGAGAVISDDIKDYTIVAPYQKLVKLPRKSQKESELVGKVKDKDAQKGPVEKISALDLPEQPISGPSVEKQTEKPGAPKGDKS
ncbi:MAG: acyltransferase, partial [Bacteroidales bacterium]|nr:acyltransferase [Bacteroidales bacterium]